MANDEQHVRTAIRMRMDGKTMREIADHLHVKPHHVPRLISRGLHRLAAAKSDNILGRQIELPRKIYDKLEAAAERRETTPQQLASDLIGTILDEFLIDAVIGDR